jgi:hypothetical protein
MVGIMKVDADELQTSETDDRGRVYLGTEYANKRVTVAVVEVNEDGPDEAELAAAYRDAADSAETLTAEWDSASKEVWDADDNWSEIDEGRAETDDAGTSNDQDGFDE